jgi:hypothetical protein
MQFTDKKRYLSPMMKARLRKTPDDKMKWLVGELDLCVGMRVAVNQNYNVRPAKIANGVLAKVYGFQWPDGRHQLFKPEVFRADDKEYTYYVPVDKEGRPVLPVYVFIAVDGGQYNYSGLPPNVYPIHPYTKHQTSYQVRTQTGLSTKYTGIKQIGLCPAYAATFYKVQGK